MCEFRLIYVVTFNNHSNFSFERPGKFDKKKENFKF